MKKQESTKKGLKWVVLACALIAVAVAVALILILSGGSSQEPPAQTQSATVPVEADDEIKIHWNVDRMDYVAKGRNGASGRMPRSDGYYYIRYAVDGEQVELPVADRTLVDQLDTMDYVGLIFDDNGVIVDFLEVHEFTGGLAANGYYVEKIEGTTYTVNTSGNYRGTSVSIEIPETAQIYNVGGEGLMVGLPGQIKPDDEIIAIRDLDGKVFFVYVIPYREPGDVYWNMTRMYDSVTGMTTREPSVTGWYEYEFAFGGEIVTLRTRDMKVANAIDKNAAKCTGLLFDEEGNISGTMSAAATSGGTVIGSWHHIVNINGDEITMEKFSGGDKGNVCTGILSEHTRIVNVSTVGTPGELLKAEDLRVGDQVHCLTDARTKLGYVFVINRLSDTAKLCWNVDRQYDSTLKTTTRYPAADGYYYITLTCEGEQFTARTKDKEMVITMDKNGAKCFAVELDGDVITKVLGTSSVTGGGVTASWYDIISISEDGKVVTAKKNQKGHAEDGNIVEVVLDDNTDVFDVSPNVKLYKSSIGQRTTLRVGDRIHCLTNLQKNAHTVFVVSRPRDIPIGWNMTRMYNSTTKHTTRTRAEDGYFHFEIAVNGKVQDLKVLSQDVADHIDSNAARCRGLVIVGDTIIESVATSAVRNANGSVEASWANVTSINGNVARAEKRGGAQDGEKYVLNMSWNCKIYNVSNVYDKCVGEQTKLRVGDLVHCLRNTDNQTTFIFVISRTIDGVVGWNTQRMYASGGTTRTPDADGWYYFDIAIDGEQKTLKTQDKAVADAVDAISNQMVGLELEGDVIKRAVEAAYTTGYEGAAKTSFIVSDADENSITVMNPSTGAATKYSYAENCGIYNVSSSAATVGEAVTSEDLKYGATVNVLTNTAGKAAMIYMTAPGVSDVTTGYCNICQKEVTWVKHNAQQPIIANVHTWLDSDVTMDACTVTAGGTYTLFLNGHTLTFNDRAFKLNNATTLNIYDSKEDGSDIGGKLIGKGIDKATADAENNGRSEGGVIMLWGINTLNLYSGTVAYEPGSLTVSHGGIVGGNGTFNMYGGTLTGGKVSGNGAQVRMFNGTFSMYGGTVAKGVAGGNGSSVVVDGNTASRCDMKLLGGNVEGDAYAMAIVPVSVGGSVKIGDVFLTADKLLNIAEPLTQEAKIGISMAVPGVFLKNTEDLTGVFSSKTYGVFYDEAARTMYLQADHFHCACADVLEHTHTSIGWAKWDGTTALKSGGSYYLTQDVTVDTWINLSGGETNICLNGHTLESKGRVFKLMGNATLNITDCGEGGKILGHGITEDQATAEQKGTSEGGVIMVWGSNTLNLYKGTLAYTAGSNPVKNGAVVAGNGVFNVYGGTITGGIAKGNGGSVRIYNGTFNLFAGAVTGGTASNGADISVGGPKGVCNIQGGTVGGIFLETGASMQVGGDIKINDVKLNANQMLSITAPLAETASIGLNMAVPGIFAMEVQEDYSDRFDSVHQIQYDETAKTLRLYIPPHIHCLCGGNGAGAAEHTCADITWQPWTSASSLPTESGNYYLTCDVTSGTLKVENTDMITLCLNGHTVNTGAVRTFTIYGKLTLTDCAGTQGVVTNANTGLAPVFYVYAGGRFDLYAGTIQPTQAVSQAGVGAVSHDMADLPDAPAGVMNLYGGTITGGKTTSGNGGAISLWNKSTLNLYGGTITGNTSAKDAGALNIGTGCYLNIYGGTITGNTANTGAGICMGANAIVTIHGGKITGNTTPDGEASNLYIASKLPTWGTLPSDAAFGITMANPGVFAENASDYSGQISSDDDVYKVSFADGKLSLESKALPHVHCVCNGTPVGDHASCTDVTWQPWTSENSLPTQSGSYYLTCDVELATMAVIQNSKDVKLCLNGFTVTSQDRVYKVYQNASNPASVLTITDCQGSGVMEGKGLTEENKDQTSNEGAVLMNWGSNTMNFYGGTFRMTEGHNTMNNGGILTGNGTINVYGGTFTDAKATNTGGCFRLFNSKLNVYGGSFGNATCSGNGTAISMAGANSVAKFLGGSISAGTGLSSVYVDNASAIIVGGDVQIDGLRLRAGQKIVVEKPLTSGSLIKLSMVTPGVFMENVETDLSAYFESAASDCTLVYDKTAKTMSLLTGHVHCLCAGAYDGTGHSHTNTQSWQAWDGSAALESDKFYYLTKNVTLSAKKVVEKGTNISICLNGYELTCGVRAFDVKGKLNVTDCKETGILSSSATYLAPVFYVFANGEFNVFGGTVKAYKNVDQAGVGAVSHDGTAGDPAGIMNLYGGTIQGNTVTNGGGTITMWNNSTLNIYGGTITGGTAGGVGGNLNLAGGCTVNMYGGTISKGTSTANGGGNLYVGGANTGTNPGKFNMYGGEVLDGTAKEGGNICLQRAEAVISGGLVSGGESKNGSGGNIDVLGQQKTDTLPRVNGKLTINGTARIENGKSKHKGGNIYMQWLSELTLGGNAVITGGQAEGLGGGILCYSMQPKLSGSVQITGNQTSDLYLDGASATNYAKLGDCQLTTGAKIGITMTYPQMFAQNVTQDQWAFFTSNDGTYKVTWADNKLSLEVK